MADETPDLSKTEQPAVLVRYTWNGVVEERLLAVESIDETTAEALYHMIRKKMQQCGIEYSNMHGQFYDGAKVTCLESILDCKHESKRFPRQQFTPIAMLMF